MSKINDDANAPIGNGTSSGWKGWPWGPASQQRLIQHGYPAGMLLISERQAACRGTVAGLVLGTNGHPPCGSSGAAKTNMLPATLGDHDAATVFARRAPGCL